MTFSCQKVQKTKTGIIFLGYPVSQENGTMTTRVGSKICILKITKFFQLHASLFEIYIYDSLLKKFHRFRCHGSVRRLI